MVSTLTEGQPGNNFTGFPINGWVSIGHGHRVRSQFEKLSALYFAIHFEGFEPANPLNAPCTMRNHLNRQ